MPDQNPNDLEEMMKNLSGKGDKKKASKGFFGKMKGIPKWFKGIPSKAKKNPRKAIMIILLAISIPIILSGLFAIISSLGIMALPAFLTIAPGFLVIAALPLLAAGLMLWPTATTFLDDHLAGQLPKIGSKKLKKDLLFSNENIKKNPSENIDIDLSSQDIFESLLEPVNFDKKNPEDYISGAEKFQHMLFSKTLADLKDLDIDDFETIIKEAIIDEAVKKMNRGLVQKKSIFNMQDRDAAKKLLIDNGYKNENITSLANDMKKYTIEYLKKSNRAPDGKINKSDLEADIEGREKENYLQKFMETKFKQQNMKRRFTAIGALAGLLAGIAICALAMGPLTVLLGPIALFVGILAPVIGAGLGFLGGYINQKYASEDLPPHKLEATSVSEPFVGNQKAQEHSSS